MGKILTGITIGLFLGVLGYYALNLFSSKEIISKDFSRVTIKNESSKNIKSVLLQHGRGRIEAICLPINDEIRFVFRNRGENVYKIVVTFEDESMLTSDEVYFELGYRGVETIRDSGIIRENNW